MFIATYFTRQGRYRGMGTGIEADVRQMATENDCLLVEGIYQGYYLVGGQLPPVPLMELTVPALDAN